MRSLKYTLLPALLLTGCGDILFLEVEQPALCKLVEGQNFGGSKYSATLDINVSRELQGLGVASPEGVDLFVGLQRARLIARSGISNFDFIDSARILVQSVDPNGLPPVEVLSYTRTGGTGPELELAQAQPINLTGYITQETLRTEAVLSGQLPSQDWSIDLEVCLYGRARLNYLDSLGAQP